MKCNVGKIDRVVRAVIGIGALAYGIANSNIVVDVIGGIVLLTAILGWCPLYIPFKINTGCRSES